MTGAAAGVAEGVVLVPGGRFVMGADDQHPEEAPAHEVVVDAFRMDATPVTNRAFRRFVEATGYRTDAERPPRPQDHPGIDPRRLVAGSAVFRLPVGPVDLALPTWWEYVPGACWRSPGGPGTDVDHLLDHPVVHVSHADAVAYATWRGGRLPTEAEWELAARSGLDRAVYAWGDEARPGGVAPANIWPGDEFPELPVGGRASGTTPVGLFGVNRYGLADLIGNVWEWTDDWFDGPHQPACCTPHNPRPARPAVDPLARGGALRVLKGGSFLCADNYCNRYRPAARIPQAADSGSSNVGFRCVAPVEAADAAEDRRSRP